MQVAAPMKPNKMMDYKLVLVFFVPRWHNFTSNSNKSEATVSFIFTAAPELCLC